MIRTMIAGVLLMGMSAHAYDPNPPFSLDKLQPTTVKQNGKTLPAYNPYRKYNVFINYELGMHCAGFDESYCCIIPPYNSIQAQGVITGKDGKSPYFIRKDNEIQLYYFVDDNSYSEGNKMRYWGVKKDVDGNGRTDDNNDNLPNYVWKHLYIYEDTLGTIPRGATKADRKYLGKDMPIKTDHGPTNKPLYGGYLDFADEHGDNVVMTETLIPQLQDVKLKLSAEYTWDALGLPLTAFTDTERRGSIRGVDDRTFQPYQVSKVRIHDKHGKAILDDEQRVYEFMGTNPIDIPNCQVCHSREGVAAVQSRKEGVWQSDTEYEYWIHYHPDVTEYMARLAEGMINMLALHDKHHGTDFLRDYKTDTPNFRLGTVSSVNCTDCHGDNISGNLKTPRDGVTSYKAVRAKPLAEAVHGFHMKAAPLPDGADRPANCQVCHPTHGQDKSMNAPGMLFRLTDAYGHNLVGNKDVRIAGGGCYNGRDAHTNPDVKPPFFLNSVGRYYLDEVSMKDEKGHRVKKMRGLYCTHCHNALSQKLYAFDAVKDPKKQTGRMLRNQSLKSVIDALAEGDVEKFRALADPKSAETLHYYAQHEGAVLATVLGTAKDGTPELGSWDDAKGKPVGYDAVSGGSDWWLSAGEPHCADCHAAPFVEDEGGEYFPMDQPNKYALYRHSKGHGKLSCQSCHESTHGMYPTRFDGTRSIDRTTHDQAMQYSPDGQYDGPVTCSACHTVNKEGVPTTLAGTKYEHDYWASVTLMHFMRQKNFDMLLPVSELMERYPYERSKQIVEESWK